MTEKLILGTVQFGIPYGINNSTGLLPENDVLEILHQAILAGIKTLDTAAAYGESESRIGHYHQMHTSKFAINTKFSKEKGVSWEDSIQNSLKNLNIPKVETLMFHSYEAYQENLSIINDIIRQGKNTFFNHLGVSVYTNEELESLIDDENIEVVQLPFNLLDNHSLRSEILLQLKDKGKIIHTRSCFLQGLFFKDLNKLPEKLIALKPSLEKIHAIAQNEKISMERLALNYALQQEYIDYVIIGVDNLEQLDKNILIVNEPLSEDILDQINQISIENPYLLYPKNW